MLEIKDIHKTFNAGTVNEKRALNGVNLHLEEGDFVTIIGGNGAGKSTLLKIITGVLSSTLGEVTIKGKVSALLELGAGFNDEYTGIENIYLNGRMMGYTRKEMDERIGKIIEFADIGDFINHPVKTYSSGMYSKLAFSITAVLKTEIMLIDEVLSVGDAKFKKKSYKKMKELITDSKRTVIIVSHSSDTIRKLCNTVLWLHDGNIKMQGSVDEVLPLYEEFMS